jgi:hypothetical protein
MTANPAIAKEAPKPPRLRVVRLDFPGIKEGDDVVDFLDYYRGQGETHDQLRQRIDRLTAEAPEFRPEDEDGRPAILITTEERQVADQAVAALAADPTVYQRGGQLVRVIRDHGPATDEGIRRPFAARIEPLPRSLLQQKLAATARWLRPGPRGPGPTHPPGWCVAQVDECAEWDGIPHLEAVIDYPVLKPDGSILAARGYDPATGLCSSRPRAPWRSCPTSRAGRKPGKPSNCCSASSATSRSPRPPTAPRGWPGC